MGIVGTGMESIVNLVWQFYKEHGTLPCKGVLHGIVNHLCVIWVI